MPPSGAGAAAAAAATTATVRAAGVARRAPLLRVPYTDPLPHPRIIPAGASSASGAIAALVEFLAPSLSASKTLAATASPTGVPRDGVTPREGGGNGKTVLLTGAGISVASGLADYRGTAGTYTLNKGYRPIYFNEFCENHEARKRYWARSFLGWTNLQKARPNSAHEAVGKLGELGVVRDVITQNVDSFHPQSHPHLPTIELHGYLRTLVCLSCATHYPRTTFQHDLSRLNPAWHAFLQEMLATGALDTENPAERTKRGLKTNPDGDVDMPGAPYSTFRYPACPACLAKPTLPRTATGEPARVTVDADGAWSPASTGGILKPNVVMFGESIPASRKLAAESAVDAASRILVVGSSLATYSAWRLVKRARERGMPIGILNIGGVRGEETFFKHLDGDDEEGSGKNGVRCSRSANEVLPEVVRVLEGIKV